MTLQESLAEEAFQCRWNEKITCTYPWGCLKDGHCNTKDAAIHNGATKPLY